MSPLMPMDARDTPCDGPMVTEMGLNVPSPLMPMIAPDTPFEGPMVNYLDAYGSPWMPMHSPDEPFEGPMVNYLDAYGTRGCPCTVPMNRTRGNSSTTWAPSRESRWTQAR